MKGYSIMNLKNTVAFADASTKAYVDSCIAAHAAQIPQALADPVDDIHLSNKRYVDRVVNDVKTRIDNQLLLSTRSAGERFMELRDDLAATVDVVATLRSTASTTSAAITEAAAVQHYVKSHVGLVPILIITNNKIGFTATSSSYTKNPVTNLFIPYVTTETSMPNVDSIPAEEALAKISCPFIVRLHSFHLAGIYFDAVKKRHSLTLIGSNSVKVEGSTIGTLFFI